MESEGCSKSGDAKGSVTSMRSDPTSSTSMSLPASSTTCSEVMKDEHRMYVEQSIQLLEKMPSGVDPFLYIEQMKADIFRNAAEEAVARKVMKRHLAVATFESKMCKVRVPEDGLLPLNGKRSSSRSAPTTPLQPLLRQQELKGAQGPEVTADTNLKTSPRTGDKGDLSVMEGALIQLRAAVAYSNELRGRVPGPQEPLIPIRSLCSKTLHFLETADFEVREGQEKVILDAAINISLLFQRCSGDEKETGLFPLVLRLINSAYEVNSDCIKALKRQNLLHLVFGGMKSIKIRTFILISLCQGVHASFNRISQASSGDTFEETVMDFDEITALFRYLQLIEFVLRTTSKEPWIPEIVLKRMTSLEEVSLNQIPFANIQIFMVRVVGYAKNYVLGSGTKALARSIATNGHSKNLKP